MSLIDREATFKGNIIDHAVSLTKNEFPQFVCKLVAKEIYDEDDQVWVDWTDVEENEITAYLVLYGKNGETLNCTQVEKATGWDGLSFQQLNDADLSEVTVQFRVEYRTYQNKTTLQVTWFDAADAEPGRAVRKLDASELKSLDAKYKAMLKNNAGKKTAPVKAGAKTTVTKPGKVTAKNIKSTAPKGPVKKKSSPSPTTAAEIADLPAGRCTKQECWDTIVELKDKSVTDEANAKAYLDAILEVSGSNDQDALTDEQWFQVKEIVLEKNAAF